MADDGLPSGLLEAGASLVMGALAGLGAAMRWFARQRRILMEKQEKLDRRLDMLEVQHDALEELLAKHDALDTRVTILEAHGRAMLDRFEKIDQGLRDLNTKTDSQTRLLIDIARTTHQGGSHGPTR